MSLRSATRYIGNRLFEWCMAIALLFLGAQVLLWPNTLADSNFRMLLDIANNLTLAIFYMVIGTARIAALIANGCYFPTWTPRIRAIGALGGALIWGQMMLALVLLSAELGRSPSPGIPVYLALTIGELFSCYRVLAGDSHGRA